MRTRTRPLVVAVLVLAVAVSACKTTSVVQKAVNLVPVAVSAVNAFEAVAGLPVGTLRVLEKVKIGLVAFESVGRDYLSSPSTTKLGAVVAAVDTFVADFDSVLPNLSPRYKQIATAADLTLHLIQAVVSSSQLSTTSTRARLATAPPHVDQAALKALARQHGLEKYVK